MNQASRIRLAKQLLHCARMVLDAKKSSKKITKNQQKSWEMVAFIFDRFNNPDQTQKNYYTDSKYKYDSVNYHHVIQGINPEIGKQIVCNRINKNLLSSICYKIKGYEKLKKSMIHDSMFFTSRESMIIQEILITQPLSRIQHKEKHEELNKSLIPAFEKAMEKLIISESPREFFGQLYVIFSEYIFPENQFVSFKREIIKYFAEQYEKWDQYVTKIR